MLRIPAFALVWLSLLFASQADRITQVERGLRPAGEKAGASSTRWTIQDRQRHYRVPAVSVAVIDEGRIAWAHAWGDGADAETLFQAASISKSVTALAAMRLVEQGRLSLDEDVNRRLRTWKVPENEFTRTEKVTLRRLLSHTAGLTVHGFGGYARGERVPTLVELLDGVPPANSATIRVDFVPGSRYRYSGGGYEVVQQLMADVTGKPFPQVMRELVLDPLGMKDSAYEQPLPSVRSGRAAVPFDGDGRPVKGGWHTYPELAAAGLWTTPSDLARVVLEVLHPKLLKPATVGTILTEVRSGYGLGFGVSGTATNREFSHNGANEGYRCVLAGLPGSNQGAVVMTNGDRGDALAGEVLRAIAEVYDWPARRP